MLKIAEKELAVALSSNEVNGAVSQAALTDLYNLKRLQSVAKDRAGEIKGAIRKAFRRKEVAGKKGTKVVFEPRKPVEEGQYNVKLALNASRDYSYKERLVEAYTEIELLKSGVRRTKKTVAAARSAAEARIKAENAKVEPTEGDPKVLVTYVAG